MTAWLATMHHVFMQVNKFNMQVYKLAQCHEMLIKTSMYYNDMHSLRQVYAYTIKLTYNIYKKKSVLIE